MNTKKCRRFRWARVMPKIDNKAPYFNVSAYLKPFKLRQDIGRTRKLEQENLNLLRKMNVIHRLGGKVDCWAPDVEYKSKLLYQERRNKEIMRENQQMLKKINRATSKYPTRESLEDWKNRQRLIQHRSRFFSTIERQSAKLDIEKQLVSQNRTKCFFDVGLKDENCNFGRIVFELYDDIAPRTCENFAALCRGGNNGLSYKRTPFHRIVVGYWCQGGDVTRFNGTGGTSIYGDSFENENFELRHAGPGVLSMCADDEGKNDSKFNLTFKRLETVDGRNIVFGRVTDGMVNVYKVTCFLRRIKKRVKEKG
ncbi:E3 SUMO-protein ligase RanBP2-like isoform X2 [Odontomachus brunneus]|uniref:E3 SUMO-protein ligase RanBP2-like isoform X2 n=1 Tax=Odontomachus brunneus TaxID=486640 RepID=UPI0013F263BB|nr:E3 SUMO-protein ligase RanBP2-like isoform X2 [Odontomachus brunneus]